MSLAKKSAAGILNGGGTGRAQFSAMQSPDRVDCGAPGIVGGGEDKALKKSRVGFAGCSGGALREGHCRRRRKDFTEADPEFTKALESNPKSVDWCMTSATSHETGSGGSSAAVVEVGKLDAKDPRGTFYLP